MLFFFKASFPTKFTSLSKFVYLSKPHSRGLSLLSKSLPQDNKALSILSIRFGYPGLTLNSFPISNKWSYNSKPDFIFSTYISKPLDIETLFLL